MGLGNENVEQHILKFGNKVGERHLDKLIHDFYSKYSEKPKTFFLFDFSDVEWISNQSLLVFTGLFKTLIDSDIDFYINFLKQGSFDEINKRKANQFAQLWEVWKIYNIVPDTNYHKYFDIDGNTIDRLKKQFHISTNSKEIYENYGVTPFLTLDQIESYDDHKVSEMLSKVYSLNEATNQVLKENKCSLPFENNTISLIITKELYENFLDHFNNFHFKPFVNQAFLSISLNRRIGNQLEEYQIQDILKKNFETESIPELIDFHYDSDKKKYRNRSCLQLSFMDFGEGISQTLKKAFNESQGDLYNEVDKNEFDNRVLEFAFQYDSSQHPVSDRYKKEFAVPRGLFDILSVVRRYRGLLIARSNFGKVIYDFSNNKEIEKSLKFFLNDKYYFPGTLITIQIPEIAQDERFDYSSIKPYFSNERFKFKKSKTKYLSLFEIQKELKEKNLNKKALYDSLFSSLIERTVPSSDEETLIYIDFNGYHLDDRVTKKIIYFLCTDYRVNNANNVIILNPPDKKMLQQMQIEIELLEEIDKSLRFHPTPFIYLVDEVSEIEIFWLGIFSSVDIDKLNDLLLEEHDLRSSDFINPDFVVGNVNSFDEYGNLSSVINSTEILTFYKDKIAKVESVEIERLINPSILKIPGSVFLCNGNYYQSEYLQLFDVLCDKDKCQYLSGILFRKLKRKLVNIDNLKFVGITSSSHKILSLFQEIGILNENSIVYLNNYFSFEKERAFLEQIKENDSIILICDVISTGYMVDKLERHLKEKGASLVHIGVLFNAIDDNYPNTFYSNNVIQERLTSLYNYPFKKQSRGEISKALQNKTLNVVRINPFTNNPITKSHNSSNFASSVLMSNQEFIDCIDHEHILAGYFEFNSLIHPYFFDMGAILGNRESSDKLLMKVFEKLGDRIKLNELDVIVYPKDSGIKDIDFNLFENKILKNHNVIQFELDRFSTNEGWRFSHPAQFLIDGCENKTILILDDGSCSGESILQMIDEVAFLNAREITVLSIVGRVNDHKREFFSRIKTIENEGQQIPIQIIFGCHWHIPTYYLSKSPVIDEKTWVEGILEYANTPFFLKKIAKQVLNEVTPKNIVDGNNRHLLKLRDGSNILKHQVLIRDEIGKISEFRFYHESFGFFNDFISAYESKSKKDRGEKPYILVEQICAVFIHEPYLYDSLKKVVPDVIDKIEEFMTKLFWANSKIKLEDLAYNWDMKNLFHLIFIVYKDDQLFQFLKYEKLKLLIKDFAISSSDLAYILFKLTYYIPLNNVKDQNIRFAGKINLLISKLIEDSTLNEEKIRMLKRYRTFTSSVTSTDSFESLIAKVKTNYEKITDDKYHNKWMSAQHDILSMQLEVLSDNYNLEAVNKVIQAFEVISTFINPLLELSKNHNNFFKPFGDDVIVSLEIELRSIYGELSDMIYFISEKSEFNKIRTLEEQMYNGFIKSETFFYQVFKNLITPCLKSELDEFIKEIQVGYPDLVLDLNLDLADNISVDIPLKMTKDVLFHQILRNFRHASNESAVKISAHHSSDAILVSISNNIINSSKSESGGGTGLSQLNWLNDFPENKIAYKSEADKDKFYQLIKFII
jgi:orotate phosphoribosyltransferase